MIMFNDTFTAKNINIKENAQDGFLRCALSWEVEKRIRELFTSYKEYRDVITEVFLDNYFAKKPVDNIRLEVPSFQARTGVSFSIVIPRTLFIHYSAMEWTTSFNSKTIPIDTPVLAKLQNGEYAIVKCKMDEDYRLEWFYTNHCPVAPGRVIAFKACE